MPWRFPLGRSIAAAQLATGATCFALLTCPGFVPLLALLVVLGMLESPLTIWAQTLRMSLIPARMRGRVFALLRTTMQGAEPLGGAAGGLIRASGGVIPAVVMIGSTIALPGLIGLTHRDLRPSPERSATL